MFVVLCYVGSSVYFVDVMLLTCALVTDVLVYVRTNMVQYRERFVGLSGRKSYAGLNEKFEIRSEEIENKFISKTNPFLKP